MALPAQAASSPRVTVSQTEGLNGAGDTITVTGTGFLPAEDGSTNGGRPPLAGQFGGAYVIFGKFADNWKPSEDAPSSARSVITQEWALNADASADARTVTIDENGTFTAQFTVSNSKPNDPGNYGIYTYAGSGAKYAPFETATPLTFADSEPEPSAEPSVEPSVEPSTEPTPEPSVEPSPDAPAPAHVEVSQAEGLVDGDEITVTGTGFLENAPATTGTRPPLAGLFSGAYVVFGQFPDDWKPSDGLPTSTRPVTDQKWAVTDATYNATPPMFVGGLDSGGRFVLNEDGTFTTTFTLDRDGQDNGGNWGIYTYPGSGVTYAPFETYTPLNFDTAPAVEVSQAEGLVDGDEITVTGTGFLENAPATSTLR